MNSLTPLMVIHHLLMIMQIYTLFRLVVAIHRNNRVEWRRQLLRFVAVNVAVAIVSLCILRHF